MGRYSGILLLGPTASGKTPLGNVCEREGLWGRRCVHFDFGACLRKVADMGAGPEGLTEGDLGIITRSLGTGGLLEDEDFHVARRILEWFAAAKALGEDDLLILNGLPRHVGQAKALDPVAQVRRVIVLGCRPEVVRERIRLNSGGDRSGRADDSTEAVDKRLRLFEERTFPLVDYFRAKGARVDVARVEVDTTPGDLHRMLESMKDAEHGPA